MQGLKLMLPAAAYAGQISAYRQAFLNAGDSMDGTGSLSRMEDPFEWLRQCEELTHEETVPAGWVPATQYICVRKSDDMLVGMIQLRHSLNESLARFGGHIGYSVHPAHRGNGYARQMLAALLPRCREIGLSRVLLTCSADNPASRKTIIGCGGVFESSLHKPGETTKTERYWIEL